MGEAVGAAGQVDVPDAEGFRIDRLADLLGVVLEVLGPQRAGARVVAAQVFDVAHFEAALLHGADHGGEVGQFAVREHVFADEVAAAVGAGALLDVGGRDAVVHHHAVRGQQLVDVAEVRRQVVHAHVLEHADAGDALELAVDVAVVLQADFDLVLQAGLGHALARELELPLRQRHADAARAELLGGANHQRAPAAADVEQGLARPHVDLGQDVVDLLLLGGGEVLVAVFEIGAGIHHRRIEEHLVELVRDVVVIANRLGVLFLRVRRDQPQGGARHARGARRLAGGFGQCAAHLDHVGRAAFDLDCAFDIGLAQAAERGREQIAQGARARHADLDPRLFVGQVDLFAIPQFDTQGQVDSVTDA